MKTHEEIKKEWYDMLFEFTQLKGISDVEKQTLIKYFDEIDSTAHNNQLHIYEKLHKIIWDLVWPHDDIMQVYLGRSRKPKVFKPWDECDSLSLTLNVFQNRSS